MCTNEHEKTRIEPVVVENKATERLSLPIECS